jgi:hypothetical protein
MFVRCSGSGAEDTADSMAAGIDEIVAGVRAQDAVAQPP